MLFIYEKLKGIIELINMHGKDEISYTSLVLDFFKTPSTAEDLAILMEIPIARCYSLINTLLLQRKIEVSGIKFLNNKKRYVFRTSDVYSHLAEKDNYINIIPINNNESSERGDF